MGLNPPVNEDSHDSFVFRTENRVLANVMAKRFRQEIANPYNANCDLLRAILGCHFPTETDVCQNPEMNWQFQIGQYGYTVLTVSTRLELGHDEGEDEELLDALYEIKHPTKYLSPPTPLLGLKATKTARKNHIFKVDELRERAASALASHIREVRVVSPMLNVASIPIIHGLVDGKLELLSTGGTIGKGGRGWYETPDAALDELERYIFCDPYATTDERYKRLEERFITDALRYTRLADLQALTAILAPSVTTHLSSPQ